jgi:tetratricopeptide (TPR) repeat protein/transcriptional regulator with XRE-family HTH domain
MLRRYRLAAGLTQEELAAAAGLSPAAISTLERGARRTPRKETVALIAEALRLGPEERALLVSVAGRRKVERATTPATGTSVQWRDTALPFIGRVSELTVIEALLADESAPLLLVAGEPGIGKSRLLREAAQRASALGWTILEGGCTRRSGQEPYAPILGALESYIHRRSPAQLHRDLQGCSWLTRLLPELADATLAPVPQWSLPPDQERRLMFAAVERFLDNVGSPSGTLLILDDLQWAGDDALDLLDALVRTSRSTRLRVLAAYRDTEARRSRALRTLQSDLAREDLVVRVALGPLAPQEGRSLLMNLFEGGMASDIADRDVVADDILRRTGGVPFYLVSCARSLRAGIATGVASEDVPWDVGENIRQRVAVLPEQAQELVAVAAIVGREIPGALLGAILEWPEADLVEALEAVCAARLLIEDGARYRFAHDLILEGVAAGLSAARRRALHWRVAGAYERQLGGGPVEVLAYHYEKSGAREQAAKYLERAADNARSVFAYTECERYYRAALAVVREQGDRRHEAALCERLGDMLATLGRREGARAAYEEAFTLYQVLGDIEGVWRSLARLTVMGRYLDVAPAAGLERLQPYLAKMDQSLVIEATPALVELYNARGMLQSDRRHDVEAVADHRRAAQLASQLGSLSLEAQASYWQARALSRGGWRPDEAVEVWEKSVPLFEAANDLPGLCDTLNNIADHRLYGGNFTQMRSVISRAIDLAERIQDPRRLAIAVCTMSEFAYLSGEWLQARAGFTRVVTLMRESGANDGMVWTAVCELGVLLLVTGAEAEGLVMLEEAAAHNQILRGEVSRILAERDLLEGRPRDALARFAAMPTHDGNEWPIAEIAVSGMPWLAWADLALGHEAQAMNALKAHMEKFPPESAPMAEARYVEGMLALLRSHYEEALATLDGVLELCVRRPYPYIEGKALYALGQVSVALGDSIEARKRYEEALAVLARLGERMYARHIERALHILLASAP